MSKQIHREITPLKENDCFLIFDRHRNDFSYPIHFHPEYEINFIVNAKGGKRIVGDHIDEIGYKELVLVGPNIYHGWENYKNDTTQELHEITIQFPVEFVRGSLLNATVLKPIKQLVDNAHRGILFSDETIERVEPRLLALSEKKGFESFLEFQSLLYDLGTSTDQKFLTNISFQKQNRVQTNDRIEMIHSYIKENYATKIKLEDAANHVNMTVVSFSRLIKKGTGKSFVDFLNEIRLGQATKLLIETNKSVGEVCFETGFNNISNFNRLFKKRQNSTPSEFRLNFKGKRNVI